MDGEALKDAATKVPTWPNWDAGIWSAVVVVLWGAIAALLYVAFKTAIHDLIGALVVRVRSGAALKLFSLEFGQMRVTASAVPSSGSISAHAASGEWKQRRKTTYQGHRHVFVAHRLFPSEVPRQLYDVLVYLVPHKDRGGSLIDITRVEYYFGDSWGNKVFEAKDRGKRFGIVVSAYGSGFLCEARVFFRDGDGEEKSFDTWRYIDFEMGPLGEGGEGLTDDAT